MQIFYNLFCLTQYSISSDPAKDFNMKLFYSYNILGIIVILAIYNVQDIVKLTMKNCEKKRKLNREIARKVQKKEDKKAWL